MSRNLRLYPWFRFFQGLVFWQAVWFLYFQEVLSAAEAILLYAVFDVSTTILEVPSGYLSDKLGRRKTLILSGICGAIAAGLQIGTDNFAVFALANVMLGAAMALMSGTDSALLYESLAAENRADEVETQELRAWRFSFSALAFSAISGAGLAMLGFAWAYAATALAFVIAAAIASQFQEPPRTGHSKQSDLQSLLTSLRNPSLQWLFVFAVVTYIFSHVVFVFGQPFVLDALEPIGWDDSAPLVSGAITATMMGLSLLASVFVPAARARFGVAAVLLAAFGAQIGIIFIMALSGSVAIFAILALRMVPDAFITPLRSAQIQQQVDGQMRATYVSLQSLVARLCFSATLAFGAANAVGNTQMARSDLQLVLMGYALVGGLVLLGLLLFARRVSDTR